MHVHTHLHIYTHRHTYTYTHVHICTHDTQSTSEMFFKNCCDQAEALLQQTRLSGTQNVQTHGTAESNTPHVPPDKLLCHLEGPPQEGDPSAPQLQALRLPTDGLQLNPDPERGQEWPSLPGHMLARAGSTFHVDLEVWARPLCQHTPLRGPVPGQGSGRARDWFRPTSCEPSDCPPSGWALSARARSPGQPGFFVPRPGDRDWAAPPPGLQVRSLLSTAPSRPSVHLHLNKKSAIWGGAASWGPLAVQPLPAYPECASGGSDQCTPQRRTSVPEAAQVPGTVLLRVKTITSVMNMCVLSITVHLAKEKVTITVSVPAHSECVGHLPNSLR